MKAKTTHKLTRVIISGIVQSSISPEIFLFLAILFLFARKSAASVGDLSAGCFHQNAHVVADWLIHLGHLKTAQSPHNDHPPHLYHIQVHLSI